MNRELGDRVFMTLDNKVQIGRAYTPPVRRVDSTGELQLQAALLAKPQPMDPQDRVVLAGSAVVCFVVVVLAVLGVL